MSDIKLNKEQREAVRELYWIAFNEGILMTYEDYCSCEESEEYLKEHDKKTLEEKLGLNTERSEVLNDEQ